MQFKHKHDMTCDLMTTDISHVPYPRLWHTTPCLNSLNELTFYLVPFLLPRASSPGRGHAQFWGSGIGIATTTSCAADQHRCHGRARPRVASMLFKTKRKRSLAIHLLSTCEDGLVRKPSDSVSLLHGLIRVFEILIILFVFHVFVI